MPATVIYRPEAYVAESATSEGDELWLSPADLEAATGWEQKPQGLCLGERCVPIPPARKSEFLAEDGRFNLAAFARYLGQPIVRADTGDIWAFGEAPEVRRSALMTLAAPDFTLPDLDGKLHSLSEYRGKKVLLFAWASW
jgi:hypothetical protein